VELFRVEQQMLLGSELLLLIGVKPGGIDLLRLKTQQVLALQALLLCLTQLPEVLPQPLIALVRLLQGRHIAAQPAKGVEECQLRLAAQQGLLLMLAEDFDEMLANLLQHRQGGQVGINVAAAAAFGDQPFQQQQRIVAGNAKRGQHLAQVRMGGEIEEGFDERRFVVRTHHLRLGALAQYQPQGPNKQRLPGPRFAGKDVEPGTEFKHHALNEGVVLNVQLH
jgi:hypothetical protein